MESDRVFISLDEDNYYRTADWDPDGFVANLSEAVILDETQRVPKSVVDYQARG